MGNKNLVKGMENIETLMMTMQRMLDNKDSHQYILQPRLHESFCRAAIDEWIDFKVGQQSATKSPIEDASMIVNSDMHEKIFDTVEQSKAAILIIDGQAIEVQVVMAKVTDRHEAFGINGNLEMTVKACMG